MIANGGGADEEESLTVLQLAVPVGLGANGFIGDFANDGLFGLGGVERVGALTGNMTFGVILWRENGVLHAMETYVSMRGSYSTEVDDNGILTKRGRPAAVRSHRIQRTSPSRARTQHVAWSLCLCLSMGGRVQRRIGIGECGTG